MIAIRKGSDRGRSDLGWLDSRHTFSFADYRDPAHLGFSVLRVINEDLVKPGKGFGTHGHSDMEIISWVLAGALQHQDSLGTGSVIAPGEIQLMTAGTGVMHSEFNASASEPVHFLQIWILPEKRGLPPGYQQKRFPDQEMEGRWRTLVSPEGEDGSVIINQDATLRAITLAPGADASTPIAPGRNAWLQIARGAVTLDGHSLTQGDGAALSGETSLTIRADRPTEALLFDLP